MCLHVHQPYGRTSYSKLWSVAWPLLINSADHSESGGVWETTRPEESPVTLHCTGHSKLSCEPSAVTIKRLLEDRGFLSQGLSSQDHTYEA